MAKPEDTVGSMVVGFSQNVPRGDATAVLRDERSVYVRSGTAIVVYREGLPWIDPMSNAEFDTKTHTSKWK